MADNKEKVLEMLQERHAYYKDTFDTQSGLKVLADLEDAAYISRSTVTDPSSVDMNQIAFREGMRTIVLRIKNFISDKQVKRIEGNSN